MVTVCVTKFKCLCVCVCVFSAGEVLLTQHCPAPWAPPHACLPASCPATINFTVPNTHTHTHTHTHTQIKLCIYAQKCADAPTQTDRCFKQHTVYKIDKTLKWNRCVLFIYKTQFHFPFSV